MFFNPSCKPEVKDREFAGISMRAFIAWLKTKPADEEYNFVDARHCAAAQYLQSVGVPVAMSEVDFPSNSEPGSPSWWLEEIVNGGYRCTFGAALERAHTVAAA